MTKKQEGDYRSFDFLVTLMGLMRQTPILVVEGEALEGKDLGLFVNSGQGGAHGLLVVAELPGGWQPSRHRRS